MVELSKANSYLENHLFNEKWADKTDPVKESALNTAENILLSHFNFRDGAEITDNYFHAVCEQAIHLLNFAPERFKLQQEGVTYYAVDGITFTMKSGLISQVAKGFLKPIIKLRVGEAK
ncbi:hypothetical protein [Virgibacillus halodenitrificans]|uniref:Phage gp6-like head-tail connector protein n=1 Tax=Virgibacillus halodenitrificans TaxID=1482 RepID=A0ABR7VPJ5_VIRHA|nr:hypothetical protein [Virgibacillus halodenitrificans]MBD1222753.1 hypothetical protein [Virgibacillus halodenitrificans]